MVTIPKSILRDQPRCLANFIYRSAGVSTTINTPERVDGLHQPIISLGISPPFDTVSILHAGSSLVRNNTALSYRVDIQDNSSLTHQDETYACDRT